MKHAQYYFARWLTAAALLFALNPAFAATMAHPTPPDPLLDGGPAGPCAREAAGADYVEGTDARGNPVVPADAGAAPVPLPDQVMIPVGRPQPAQGRGRQAARNPVTAPGEGAYVSIDGRRLAPLVNPPSCGKMPGRAR